MLRIFTLCFAIAFATQGFCEETGLLQGLEIAQAPKIKQRTPPEQSKGHFIKVRPSLELKAGYFFFASSTMRDIYTQGGLDLQLAGAYSVWRGLQIYGSLEYLERSGHSLSGHKNTSIWELPVNLGIRPVITICEEVQWYLALGPRYFYIHQHNDSSFVDKNKGKSGIGLFVNTGFNFTYNHLLVDVFGEYSYEKIHFHTSKPGVHTRALQVGGFTFGAGLGYLF